MASEEKKRKGRDVVAQRATLWGPKQQFGGQLAESGGGRTAETTLNISQTEAGAAQVEMGRRESRRQNGSQIEKERKQDKQRSLRH